ncbi:MAG: cupin domain-containing protein, partial [Actinomycetota bacterium]|nr:cupin domain-containing protein [Actinomycetota bacterium]
MNSRPIKEAISFSEEKLKKNALFDSQRLFYDLYCLLPGQHQKVHAHKGSDKVY